MYAIDFRYANGNGPINTENKCAIRTLRINDQFAGTIVLPQRGKNEWSKWGFSNSVKVYLEKGSQTIGLRLEDPNDNMNGEINQATLEYYLDLLGHILVSRFSFVTSLARQSKPVKSIAIAKLNLCFELDLVSNSDGPVQGNFKHRSFIFPVSKQYYPKYEQIRFVFFELS